MEPIIIYHNPQCSKSRKALTLLKENGVNPEIIYYLDNPPTLLELKDLVNKLDLGLRDILRIREPEYSELLLSNESLSEEMLFDIVCKHPNLIQRPIIIRGNRAVLGRPPENVLSFLKN
ncbi:MAG: arsenate reductase (glutaredoxin) [Pseudomonadota bacterium]|nr:arsenate reductase (glutaredoxin) [Pseudomonadota bacterium]